MRDPLTNSDDDVAVRLSEDLKIAFGELASADVDPSEKVRRQQRLIAITNMSKRDVVRAAEQLARARNEWDMFRQREDEQVDGTDR